MQSEYIKSLQAKVNDYTRFSFILICVSVFLYIGVLIPNEDKGSLQINLLMVTTFLFLVLAFYFFRKVISLKREIQNIDS
ncbi:YrhC family protein [Bacillus timonensis]|nr:YrhC family protein [Bacillus timonensis]